MKIILRQFVIVDDNNTEIRTKRTFEEVKKAYKRGNLFIEQCETIKQKGFEFNHTYRKALVGRLGIKLKFNDYVTAKKSINY